MVRRKILVVKDAVEQSAGAEIAFDEKTARMIDAAVGLSGQRVEVTPEQPRDDGIARIGRRTAERVGLTVESVAEECARADIEFPVRCVPDRRCLLCAVKE